MSSKTISTVSEGYKIESLTIAVVVNRKRLLASLGEGATPEAVDKQLKEVERLVGSAAGVDAKRGDRVTVAAVEFLQSGQPSSRCRRRASSSSCSSKPAASSTRAIARRARCC